MSRRDDAQAYWEQMNPQQFRGRTGYDARVDAAQARSDSQYGNDGHWNRIVETAHAYHHATRGPDPRDPVPDRERNAAALMHHARQRARVTRQSVAEVLAESGFHPGTGMSMRPAPEHPEWETNQIHRVVRVGALDRARRGRVSDKQFGR